MAWVYSLFRFPRVFLFSRLLLRFKSPLFLSTSVIRFGPEIAEHFP